MFNRLERFCENVGDLIIRRYVLQIDDSIFELLAYVMVTNFDVFRARMKFRIAGECDCQLIVNENGNRAGRTKTQFGKELTKENGLSSCQSRGHISQGS